MTDHHQKQPYRMPAEWEPHSAVWLAWPYDTITFGSLNQKDNLLNSARLAEVEQEFLKIINALCASEPVNLLVTDEPMRQRISALMQPANVDLNKINFYTVDYTDVWTRDYLPLFVKAVSGQTVAVKWEYNAYGGKFPALIKDNQVWQKINLKINFNTLQPAVWLEGGAVEVNGQGVLLTTEQCLFKRNPDFSKADYEQLFAQYLGIEKVIWLKGGLVNDHTDGHIDELARFVAPHKIVCAYSENRQDENYEILEENFQVLNRATDARGRAFEIIKLPVPQINYDDGTKAPVSYTNFYIGNRVVLVSVFNVENDEEALRLLADCLPGRRVVPIDCSEIIYGGGAVHCLTMQQPV